MRDASAPVTRGPPPQLPLARVTPDRALPALPNAAWIAVLFFVGAETMIFAGLLTTFGIYRLASPVWPPFGEPRLPIAVTAANTVLLLLSAGTVQSTLTIPRAQTPLNLAARLDTGLCSTHDGLH